MLPKQRAGAEPTCHFICSKVEVSINFFPLMFLFLVATNRLVLFSSILPITLMTPLSISSGRAVVVWLFALGILGGQYYWLNQKFDESAVILRIDEEGAQSGDFQAPVKDEVSTFKCSGNAYNGFVADS